MGEGNQSVRELGGGYVFVTVGTTSFDALIRAADSTACRQALSARGYSSMVFQIGRGSYLPDKNNGDEGGLKTNYFTFSPSLADYIKNAGLIISHAGSGSIFEALRAGRPLVVVVNDALMDNHQMELAEELAESKYLFCASPGSLVNTITTMDLDSLVRYPASTPLAVVQTLDRFLGFPEQ